MAEGKKKKLRDLLLMVVAVVVGLGVVAVYGFYQDEAKGFIRLQGWNLGAVTAETRKLVQAMNADNTQAVEPFLDLTAPEIKKHEQDGKWVGLITPDYGGPRPHTWSNLAPKADGEFTPPEMIFLQGGAVRISVIFAGEHGLGLRWDRRGDQWKVIGVDWIDVR